MDNKNIFSSFFPLFLFVLLWVCFHSLYQYHIDPDTAACLQISDAYAQGHFWDAINGLWSPLQCWLVAIIHYTTPLSTLNATHTFNFILGLLLLWRLGYIITQWQLSNFNQLLLKSSFAIFLFYACHAQLFGDILLSYCILEYLNLTQKQDFLSSTKTVLIAGLLIGIGTLSKSYAFYFGGLHFLCLLIYTYKFNFKKYTSLAIFLLGIAICIIPWVFCIHEKYGVWNFSLAGMLNRSWLLNGTYQLKKSIQYFIIPFSHTIAHWQDPFWTEDHFSTVFDSSFLIKKQLARLVFAFWEFIQSATIVSWAYLLLFFQLVKQLIKKNSIQYIPINTWSIAILSLPIGYLTIHVESRYLWPSLIPCMLFCFSYLDQESKEKDAFTLKTSAILLALSFIIFPIIYLKEHKNAGKEIAVIAQHLPENLKGKYIVSNIDPNQGIILAYWSKSLYCSPIGNVYTDAQWPRFAYNMHISYYIEFHENSGINHTKPLNSLNYSALHPIYQTENLTIYQIAH
ncbi:MAG: hypothetical protein KGN97_02400 [Bacteroidota bacterium]|nr:hypothetical protein [Bacteroidota bacterium]